MVQILARMSTTAEFGARHKISLTHHKREEKFGFVDFVVVIFAAPVFKKKYNVAIISQG
jgi:hypothetical protein